MNFWKTIFDGGHPLLLDDFRYMDAATRDAMTKIVIGLNRGITNCIVMGVEFLGQVGDQDSFSAGLLLVNGELVLADAQLANTTDIIDVQAITFAETADPAGNKTFEDAGVHDVYIQRRAIIQGYFTGTVPGGAVTFRTGLNFQFPRIDDSILGALVEFFKAWKETDAADITFVTADCEQFGGYGMVSKKVATTGRINLDLKVLISSGTPSQIEINGPAGWVPQGAINRFIGTGSDGEGNVINFHLSAAGKIFFYRANGDDFASGPPIYFRLNSGDFPLNP